MTAHAVKVLRADLREAVESDATVTIVLDSGRTHTGTVKVHPAFDGGYYLLSEVGTRRPVAFHKLDLERVIFE